MEKKAYEAIKAMRKKVESGTSTFAERNILKIIDKKARKKADVRPL